MTWHRTHQNVLENYSGRGVVDLPRREGPVSFSVSSSFPLVAESIPKERQGIYDAISLQTIRFHGLLRQRETLTKSISGKRAQLDSDPAEEEEDSTQDYVVSIPFSQLAIRPVGDENVRYLWFVNNLMGP